MVKRRAKEAIARDRSLRGEREALKHRRVPATPKSWGIEPHPLTNIYIYLNPKP